ncbi:hypothetical protein [Burkholderia glumae]|uniref:hypothetical protein n=1 Tax=Burkholderia glumae TaxID=337 RepID=UPI00265D89A1|nr:hypothetical protein [Burkholderia glumae]
MARISVAAAGGKNQRPDVLQQFPSSASHIIRQTQLGGLAQCRLGRRFVLLELGEERLLPLRRAGFVRKRLRQCLIGVGVDFLLLANSLHLLGRSLRIGKQCQVSHSNSAVQYRYAQPVSQLRFGVVHRDSVQLLC